MSAEPGADECRLDEARNVWIATVRPNGRPHLVPIWFVIEGDHWYVCVAPGSVKARNLHGNPYLALALEDGDQPYIVEGQARPVDAPAPAVIGKFKAKYDWDITTDAHYSQVFEIQVARRVMGP